MPEPIESIEVQPSEDNGNVPAEAVAPVAPNPAPQEPAPAADKAEPEATPEPELFELPDGRKVDATTLSKEFKENFLPEFTRKSQELARLTKTDINNPQTADPLANPDYVPQSYAEIIKIAKEATLKEIADKEKAVIEQRQAVENAVTEQLNAVKAIDKNVNENSLFLHATKYQFKDLRVAYQNMQDMAKLAKDVKQTTAKEVLKRSDPVSITPGASGGQKPDPSMFENARDYLRSLQN